MKEGFTYEMPSPTATAVVGLPHRGSRVETHAAAAMRQPYGGLFGFVISWTLVTGQSGNIVQDVTFDAWGTPYGFTATGTEPATSVLPNLQFGGREYQHLQCEKFPALREWRRGLVCNGGGRWCCNPVEPTGRRRYKNTQNTPFPAMGNHR